MCDTLLKDPLLNGQFSRFTESYGIENIYYRDQSFRRFVNYTLFRIDDPDVFVGKIEWLDFVCVCEITPEFDGIGIQVNGHLVRSKEDIELLQNSSEKLEIDIVFVKIGHDSDDDKVVYDRFCDRVLAFFKTDIKSADDPLMPYHELVDYIYTDKSVAARMDDYPRLKLWFLPASPFKEIDFQVKKDSFLTVIRDEDFYFGETSLLFISGKKLVEYVKELENKFLCNIRFKEQFQLAVGDQLHLKNAISFTCEAKELLKLLVRDDGSMRRSLFNDNVRDYLGYTTVNTEIENTIRENPDMFLLCNNGITIVCGKFDLDRNKTINIEDPQIVNGCQTCNSIYNLRESPGLDRVQIQIRLIWTDNTDLTNMIVRGTNKQNNVLDEAFETLRPFHQKLESYFDLHRQLPSEVKLFYERRTKQYSRNPSISKYQIVNLRIITQSFVAMFMGLPHIAHWHESKLLKEFAGESRVIYCDDHSLLPYFVCSYTWYSIDQLCRRDEYFKRFRVYSSHLYLLLRYSYNKPLPSFFDEEAMSDYCEGLMSILVSPDFPQKMRTIIETFTKVLDIWTKSGGSKYAVKDRKDFTDLMTVVASNQLDGIPYQSIDRQIWYHGKVVRFYGKKKLWFATIRPDYGGNNFTIDSRSYDGPIREIVPGRRVRFTLKESKDKQLNVWKVETL